MTYFKKFIEIPQFNTKQCLPGLCSKIMSFPSCEKCPILILPCPPPLSLGAQS